MQQVRRSKQRDAILANLQARYDHPTAMELYLSVRQELPNLSLGTLYRNLKGLCQDGTISCLSVGGEEHYDANAKQHYHLKCNCCGRFYDLPYAPLSELDDPTLPEFTGEIHGYSLIFFGVCPNCAAQNRTK